MLIIISNILGAIGSLFLILSQFKKSKRDVIKFGMINSFIQTFASVFALAFSRITTNTVAFTRDFIAYKNKLNKSITISLIILQTILGIIFNNKGYIGILPIVASILYTAFLFKSKTAQGIRIGLLINVSIWIVHDIYINLYTSLIGLGFVFISSFYNILKNKRNKNAH